jgi:parallel beta-helix repeat protein
MPKKILIPAALFLALVLVATVLGLRGGDSGESSAGTEGSVSGSDKSVAGSQINQLINRANPGDTVRVPGGRVYRETVVVDKPITLIAEEGAEIRGSDVWENWQPDGSVWRSEKTYPNPRVEGRWRCEEGTGQRCKQPEQVYLDGEPLEQVRLGPGEGEFTLDGNRRVLLGENPANKTVEVSVRDRWVKGSSDNVTIRGFTMRHSTGTGIKNDLRANWRVIGNDLAYAHTTNVTLSQGPGMVIENNNLHHAGQMGLSSYKARIKIRGNRIHNNNTASFKTGWESGGMKISAATDALIENNEVFENADIGIWTDVATTGPQKIMIRDNRVHGNPRQGIRVEISKNAEVTGNVVYDNGMGYPPDDPSGAGITLSGTYDSRVSDNVLAYNNSGLVVVNANREKGFHTVTNVILSSNDVIQEKGLAAAWMKAYPGGDIYNTASGNGGQDNRYYYPDPPSGESRYKWERYYENLSGYEDTLAEYNGSQLSDKERDNVLKEHSLNPR